MARRTRYRPTDGFIPLAFWPTADSAPVPVQASRSLDIHSAPARVPATVIDPDQPHHATLSQPARSDSVVFVPAPVPAGGIDGMDRATRQAFLRVTTDPEDALVIRALVDAADSASCSGAGSGPKQQRALDIEQLGRREGQ